MTKKLKAIATESWTISRLVEIEVKDEDYEEAQKDLDNFSTKKIMNIKFVDDDFDIEDQSVIGYEKYRGEE